MDKYRFFVQPAPWARGCEVFIQCDNGTWIREVDQCHEEIDVPDGSMPPVAMRLQDVQAQELMDKLWQAGYRPTEGKGSAGALAATERHLADMRRLVFESSLVQCSTSDSLDRRSSDG